MKRKVFSSLTDQVTEMLRSGMIDGRWRNTLPGRECLAKELGCSHWTIEEAMQRLIREGAIVSQGAGRKRRIALAKEPSRSTTLRVKILLYEKSDRATDYLIHLVNRLQDAGHDADFAGKNMQDLGMEVKRISRYVKATEADAWIVVAGPLGVLEWFAEQGIPAFALFGRVTQVPLASGSPDKAGALHQLVDHLIDLGHTRIVLITREERRKPTMGFFEQSFLSHLSARRIPTGPYNLPDWGDTPENLYRAIDSLFQHTPPSALIMDEPQMFFAVMQHLARLKLAAPNDISLACTDASADFSWCMPAITHITWDTRPIVHRVVKWVTNISHGKNDKRKRTIAAQLFLGGTIGPVPLASRSS